MNSAIIVMTILGCGQGEAACNFVRTVETEFPSRPACEARMEAELLKSGAANYPTVIAVCEPKESTAVATGTPDLARPSASPETAASLGEPKVIAMPEDLKPKNPLAWTFHKTRQLVAGTKRVVVSSLRKLVGRGRQNSDPVLLGQFAPGDL